MCFRPPSVDQGPVKCPKCGAMVDPNLDACPKCGAKATAAVGAPPCRDAKRTFDSKGPRCSGCTFRTECAKDAERSLCPRSAKSQCASGVVKSEYLGARSI